MSARLTPTTVAEREVARLQRRRTRLQDELQEVDMDLRRWWQVLEAVNGQPNHDQDDAA